MDSLNPEFALYGRTNKCAGTDTVFFSISEVCTRGVTLGKMMMKTWYVFFFKRLTITTARAVIFELNEGTIYSFVKFKCQSSGSIIKRLFEKLTLFCRLGHSLLFALLLAIIARNFILSSQNIKS